MYRPVIKYQSTELVCVVGVSGSVVLKMVEKSKQEMM